jgi:hypothetical protein
MAEDYQQLRDIAETWNTRKRVISGSWDNGASQASLDEFTQVSNALARRIISLVGVTDPDVLSSFSELFSVAAGMVVNAKTFVNGRDRTNT